MTTNNNKIQRRYFIKATAITGGGLLLNFSWLSSIAQIATTNSKQPTQGDPELNAFIKISPDNTIRIYNPNPDFGQNVMTSLPMIIAEELDADWNNVVVEMAPHNNAKLGPQFSGGSNSVRMYWKQLREAGGTARAMLIAAAAKEWKVSTDEITTSNSVLYHKASNKSATYGSMATLAATLPVPKEVKLKKPKDFKIIGHSKQNVEGLKIVTGASLFGLDYKQEGMLIAMIVHPPSFGMRLASFDATEALAMPGIKDVFELQLYPEDFEQASFDTHSYKKVLAIVGTNTWQVMNARKKLQVTWTKTGERKDIVKSTFTKKIEENVLPEALETTKLQLEKMKAYASMPAKELRKDGNPEKAFKDAAQILERTYTAPFLAHNCMEPINFFAHVTNDKALLAGPLQAPAWAQPTLAKLLNIPADKIEIKMTRMGGGFGRRAYSHCPYEAALISKKMNAPIKLIYTREDDMTYGIYRPMYTATYAAALDADNNLIGLHIKGGGIPEHPIHENRFPAGAVDNYLAEGWEIPSNITIGAFRAPRSNFNAAAEQCFLDELAELIGKDPIEFRLELLKKAKEKPVGKTNDYDADRYAGVLKKVKESANWKGTNDDKYSRGVAAYYCHNSYAAHIVDMVKKNGQAYVEKVYSAIDCGIVINPDAAANMVQGAVVDGIGTAMYGKLTHYKGATQQTNFNNYRMIRMPEAPLNIEVAFVENDIDPTGLGEPPYPPVFGAVANALYKLEGKRHYDQPFGSSVIKA